MGPSDIKRIDLNQEGSFTNAQPSLIIMVVAPEEKRLDPRITRSVTIKPHDDQLLCPVAASTTYNILSVLPLRLVFNLIQHYPISPSISLRAINMIIAGLLMPKS